jgi:hypothetical protein
MDRSLNDRRLRDAHSPARAPFASADGPPDRPVATRQTRVAFENALLRIEWNVIRNSATRTESTALRIVPADESRHVVVLVPVLTDGRLLMLRRYRYAPARWSTEFPRYWGQSSDSGWRQHAQEQLLKNTGLQADRMRLLGAVQVDPALFAVSTVVVLADSCTGPLKKRPDPDELISGSVTLNEIDVDELMRQGEIACGTTLSALCLYRAQERP